MKKILSACSVVTLIACGSALAGGPEIIPPAAPNCFDGFSIGIEGAFWDVNFSAYDAGRIFCEGKNCKTTEDSYILGPYQRVSGPTPEVWLTSIRPTDFSFNTVFSDNGDGSDFTGAIGIQATYGKVFHGASFNNFYLGVTGSADFGSASDTVTSKAKNISGLLDFKGTTTEGFFDEVRVFETEANFTPRNTFDNQLAVPSFNASGSIAVDTHVDMDNLYGVAAKIGYLFAPNVLGYIKAGAAWSEISADTVFVAHLNLPVFDLSLLDRFSLEPNNSSLALPGKEKHDHKNNFITQVSTSDTEVGWLLGAGVEYCLMDNFTLNAEYNFVDFGSISSGPGEPQFLDNAKVQQFEAPFFQPNSPTKHIPILNPQQLINATAIQPLQAETDLKVSTFKIGLNYYFNFM